MSPDVLTGKRVNFTTWNRHTQSSAMALILPGRLGAEALHPNKTLLSKILLCMTIQDSTFH